MNRILWNVHSDLDQIDDVMTHGHCNYYGITDNRRAVGNFIDECRSLIYKWLNRRSQKKSFNWEKYVLFLKLYPLPRVKTHVNIFELGVGSSYYCK